MVTCTPPLVKVKNCPPAFLTAVSTHAGRFAMVPMRRSTCFPAAPAAAIVESRYAQSKLPSVGSMTPHPERTVIPSTSGLARTAALIGLSPLVRENTPCGTAPEVVASRN